MKKAFVFFGLALGVTVAAIAFSSSTQQSVQASGYGPYYLPPPPPFVGAVYAMSNDFYHNTVVAYGRRDDGTLQQIGEFFTGGRGAAFDGGEGLDPLISANALITSTNRRFLFAVNAGSNTVTVFRIRENFRLVRTDQRHVAGVGPNSLAYFDGTLYVSSIDADGQFAGEPDQEGALTGFRVTPNGRLRRINGSIRLLENRPSALQFSPDGKFLVVSSINAGSSALASDSQDEIVVYGVRRNGRLTGDPISAATSTFRDNPEGRNLPSAIGFEIVEARGDNYIVVTEAREFRPDGSPPAFFELQTGSVSTWELQDDGNLLPVQLDVLTGTSPTDGGRTACWIEFSDDEETFWVSNALDASISSFSFLEGNISLIEEVAAQGTPPDNSSPAAAFGTTDGFIDLWISDDGRFLYQLFGLSGEIGVYRVSDDGDGAGLEHIETVGGLPDVNTQGIVAF